MDVYALAAAHWEAERRTYATRVAWEELPAQSREWQIETMRIALRDVTVYEVWDSTRIEHGEGPELVEIYATRALAQAFIDGFDEEAEFFSIEEHTVRQTVQ